MNQYHERMESEKGFQTPIGIIIATGFGRELIRDFDVDERNLHLYPPGDHRLIHYHNVQRAKRKNMERAEEARVQEARDKERKARLRQENQRDQERQIETERARRYSGNLRGLQQHEQRSGPFQQQNRQSSGPQQGRRPEMSDRRQHDQVTGV